MVISSQSVSYHTNHETIAIAASKGRLFGEGLIDVMSIDEESKSLTFQRADFITRLIANDNRKERGYHGNSG